MKRLGLRVRVRHVAAARGERPGRISFDDCGEPQFEWAEDKSFQDSDTGEYLNDHVKEYLALALADEQPAAHTPIRRNPEGLSLGYNPYESGLLTKKEYKRKRDLRELSRWIDMKRKLASGEK